MTYTSLAGGPPSGLGNHEGAALAADADKKTENAASEPEESETTCQGRERLLGGETGLLALTWAVVSC